MRGMDTIQDFVQKEAGVKINRFLVSGASKVRNDDRNVPIQRFKKGKG